MQPPQLLVGQWLAYPGHAVNPLRPDHTDLDVCVAGATDGKRYATQIIAGPEFPGPTKNAPYAIDGPDLPTEWWEPGSDLSDDPIRQTRRLGDRVITPATPPA